MRSDDGLRRIAFAASAAGLMWLAGRVVRASDPFIAIAQQKGLGSPLAMTAAKLFLAIAKSLCVAREWADEVARPARRT
jgi:hypothetical protein